MSNSKSQCQPEHYLDIEGGKVISCIGVHSRYYSMSSKHNFTHYIRYIVLGHEDGTVSGWYTKNKARMLESQVSRVRIVSVQCETLAGEADVFIYAGDCSGRVMTLSRRGFSYQHYSNDDIYLQEKLSRRQQYPTPHSTVLFQERGSQWKLCVLEECFC